MSAKGGYHYFEPLPDEHQVTPCRISGWMPWLPPTPAPTIAPRAKPKATVYSGEWHERRDRKTAPVRKVERLVSQSEQHTPHGYRTVYLYELECKHYVRRHQTCLSAACPECPRELR